MPFCTKCGRPLDENAKFCTSCGSPAKQAPQAPDNNDAPTENRQPRQDFNQQAQYQQTQYQQNPQQNQYRQNQQQTQYRQNSQQNQGFYQNSDGTYTYTGPVNEDGMYVSDVEKNKYLNILSYLGILFLVPYFCAKGSKYTRFHVNQGIILLILNVAYAVAKAIVMAILKACLLGGLDYYFFSPLYGIYAVINAVLSLAGLVFCALAIYGIYNTCTGKCRELPVIGKIRILK